MSWELGVMSYELVGGGIISASVRPIYFPSKHGDNLIIFYESYIRRGRKFSTLLNSFG
jgi:hypothetical protein